MPAAGGSPAEASARGGTSERKDACLQLHYIVYAEKKQ